MLITLTNVVSVAIMIGPHVTLNAPLVYTRQYLYCLWVKRGKHVIGNLDVINRDIAPIFMVHH